MDLELLRLATGEMDYPCDVLDPYQWTFCVLNVMCLHFLLCALSAASSQRLRSPAGQRSRILSSQDGTAQIKIAAIFANDDRPTGRRKVRTPFRHAICHPNNRSSSLVPHLPVGFSLHGISANVPELVSGILHKASDVDSLNLSESSKISRAYTKPVGKSGSSPPSVSWPVGTRSNTKDSENHPAQGARSSS